MAADELPQALVTPDLFKPETREQKTRYYAAAKRWADRLPFERGNARKKCYELMRENLFRALRT